VQVIIKRGKRYGVRIYRSGRQEWIGTYSTRREAREAEREELSRGRASREETCASFARRWVEDFPRPRASTNRKNGYDAEAFAAAFESTRMSDVSRAEARQWAQANRSRASAIRAMFNDALDEEIVTSNPFANLRIEQSRGRRDLEVISQASLHELADAALTELGSYGAQFRACILFAAYVGLRPAELFMLKWTDIDFERGLVTVRLSLGNTGEVTLPKNGRTRTVVLPPTARDALRSMPRRTDTPYVFSTPSGTRLGKTTHYYYWRAVRLAAGRSGMDFYELRHFCATRLLELGVSHADVAIQLGHTDGGALVMSTYGHPSEDLARERIRDAWVEEAPQLRPVKSPGGDQDAA